MMKKKKLISILILVIILFIIILSFIKLPISLISKEQITEATDGKLELSSYNTQYFKLLPTPYIELIESVFNLKTMNNKSVITSKKIEITRSLFNDKKYQININDSRLHQTGIGIKNLEIDLLIDKDFIDLTTNIFQLDESKVQLDIKTKEQSLYSIKFDIKNLNLKKEYSFINQFLNIDFNFINGKLIKEEFKINIQGTYTKNQLIIDNLEINISENSSIKIRGIINNNNPQLSSLNIILNNIDSEFIDKNYFSGKISDLIHSLLPDGKIVSSKIIIEKGLFNLNFLNYQTNKGNKLSVKSLGIIQDMNNPNLGMTIEINNYNEMKNLINKLPYNQVSSFINMIEVNQGQIDLIIKDKILEVSKIQLQINENEKIFISGDYNINNQSIGDLKIELKNTPKDKIQDFLNIYDKKKNMNDHLKLLNFKTVNASIIFTPENKLILINKLDFISDNNSSSITGLLKKNEFTGIINLTGINLAYLDGILLKTKRLEGSLDLAFRSNGLISFENIIDTEGLINGKVNIKINDSEITLLKFLQSLTSDINDLKAFNGFIKIITSSFTNQDVNYEGIITNYKLNEFVINDLIFTAPNNDILKANIKINGENFELTLIDIFEEVDFILTRSNNEYSFEKKDAEGIITEPVEKLIKKNLNQLFENILN